MPDMSVSPSGSGHPGPGTPAEVAIVVHVLHRRRGWAWTLCGSLITFIAFVAIGVNFWPNATGAVGAISGIIVIALLFLALIALITVITDTVWLRRRAELVRTIDPGQVAHHPVAAHPFRTPVRHRGSHIFVWVFLALWIGLSVAFLPDQVNAIAYVAGAGSSVTFQPQSYQQVCGRGGCHDETNGALETNPPVNATWPDQVPLDLPFRVRQPVWDGWGSPDLMNGTAAGGDIFGALFFDIPALIIIYSVFLMARHRLRRRRDAGMPMISATS
jgi:hypothetical protein